MSAPAPHGGGSDPDDVGEYASPACLMHEFRDDYFGARAEPEGPQGDRPGHATRLVPSGRCHHMRICRVGRFPIRSAIREGTAMA